MKFYSDPLQPPVTTAEAAKFLSHGGPCDRHGPIQWRLTESAERAMLWKTTPAGKLQTGSRAASLLSYRVRLHHHICAQAVKKKSLHVVHNWNAPPPPKYICITKWPTNTKEASGKARQESFNPYFSSVPSLFCSLLQYWHVWLNLSKMLCIISQTHLNEIHSSFHHGKYQVPTNTENKTFALR